MNLSECDKLWLVFTDGHPAYAIPCKWKVPEGKGITHYAHDHNNKMHPFVDPKNPENNSQRVENVNSLIKTTALFPMRGSYEPHLHSVVEEFGFHREDGSSKLPRLLY